MKFITCPLLLLMTVQVTAGELHGPHNHGEMELLVNWQTGHLSLEIVATAQDLIGYERDPESAKEKKALRDFDRNFDPFVLFSLDQQAACDFREGRSSSDLFSAAPHKHGLLSRTHSHPVGIQGHVDFRMLYRYNCRQAPEITVKVFHYYPAIKKINIRSDTIDGPIKHILTSDKNQLKVE